MRRLLFFVALSALCEVSSLAQGIVWNWVPNSQQAYGVFTDPIGDPVYTSPLFPVRSIPIDMTGNGTVDFEFQTLAIGPPVVQVLPEGSNAVLSVPYSPPNIGQGAVLLNSGNQVSSLTPVGASWLPRISGGPFDSGSDLLAGTPGLDVGGQFINQRGYVGVEFYAADGIHFGALDVAGSTDLNLIGFLFGYGYNPVPNAPFNLSDIPPMPAPEPSARNLCFWGIMVTFLGSTWKRCPR